MSALVSPRGLASPSRSARFSSAWRETQRPAQLGSCPGTAPLQALPTLAEPNLPQLPHPITLQGSRADAPHNSPSPHHPRPGLG